MRAILASARTVALSLVLAFFATDKLCLLHEAYELRRAKIDKEAWLRSQCNDPVFFSNMGEHTTLCQEVEATHRIGAMWFALNEVAESLPVADFLLAIQRLGWPVLATVAVVCLVFPSVIIAQWRASAAQQLVLPQHHTAYQQHYHRHPAGTCLP